MIVGPAVLTTLLTVSRTYGCVVTVAALVPKLVIVWVVLCCASLIGRVLRDSGSRAIAKVFNLVPAAIAVTFIRQGLMATMAR